MERPGMILFDYGGTLIYEPRFDPRKCDEALFGLIKDNPNNVTLDEYSSFFETLFKETHDVRHERHIEIHEFRYLRYALDYFGLTLSVPMEQAEIKMFKAISDPRKTPGSEEMLRFLSERNIRTGVISNLCWSGGTLSAALREFYPEHEFEFVITSSEYIFRKPDRHIFELAVRKAGLEAKDIWFCGNDLGADIIGAHEAGLTPVFMDNSSLPHFEKDTINIDKGIAADIPYHRITSWEDLKELLT